MRLPPDEEVVLLQVDTQTGREDHSRPPVAIEPKPKVDTRGDRRFGFAGFHPSTKRARTSTENCLAPRLQRRIRCRRHRFKSSSLPVVSAGMTLLRPQTRAGDRREIQAGGRLPIRIINIYYDSYHLPILLKGLASRRRFVLEGSEVNLVGESRQEWLVWPLEVASETGLIGLHSRACAEKPNG